MTNVRSKAMFLAGAMVLGLGLARPVFGGQDAQMTTAELQSALSDMGLEPKPLSEAKFEVTMKTTGFTVPLGVEISKSGNFIWITANLGGAPDGEKSMKLLKSNSSIQPSHFYVTSKDSLMIGRPLENRGLSNAVLRKALDQVANDVDTTSSIWSY